MPTKQLNRLIFAQGGQCFFCGQALPKAEASMEHLVAKTNGGDNHDENCVACCKALNALLGSMSLKQKLQVVLNQKGQFKCPNGVGSTKTPVKKPKDGKLERVIADLKKRGNSRPRTLETLTSAIVSRFSKDLSETEVAALIQQLQSTGRITVSEDKINYDL